MEIVLPVVCSVDEVHVVNVWKLEVRLSCLIKQQTTFDRPLHTSTYYMAGLMPSSYHRSVVLHPVCMLGRNH